ncbi:hypothetical protein ACHAW5_002718 [Stephanodiscus triporus]|uniref:PDZ domain-containing protein n=1 Tax=Stephanodiscus triporus TaxID=2934178 RepID=A0ABD3MKW1_9STRA
MLPAAAATALLLVLFSSRATAVSSAQCSVELKQECEWDSTGYYATTILFLAVADADVSEYDADISFHWGGAADTKVSYANAANAGEEEVSRTHVWDEGGDHYAGYTVSFDGGIGCDTRLHTDYFVVHYDDECAFEDFAGSNVPTMSAVDVLTSTPTEAGTDVQSPSAPPIATPEPTIQSTSPTNTPSPNSNYMQEYSVSSTMFLSYSDVLHGDSEAWWIGVTETLILIETALIVGVLLSAVTVDVTIKEQMLQASTRSRMLATNPAMHAVSIGALRRNLQSPSPLQIMFDTNIRFVSDRQDWNANDMVAGGFQTSSEQSRYILKLKEGNTTHFDNVTSMSLEVEGEPVQSQSQSQSLKNQIMAIHYTILSLEWWAVRSRKHNRNQRGDVKAVEVDKDEGEEIPFDNNTFPDTLNNQHYFGTIQQTDFDDISTLGDPYMGEVVNPAMNTDVTVAESLLSNQGTTLSLRCGKTTSQLLVWKVGWETQPSLVARPCCLVKITLWKTFIKLLDALETSPLLISSQLWHRQECWASYLTILAGIFQLCMLSKKQAHCMEVLKVGDMLVSVDEVDCRGMTSHTISSFLSSRSQNPTRTLVLARGSKSIMAL